MKKIVLALLLCLILPACKILSPFPYNGITNINQVAPYPDPKPGYSRFAIFLPPLDQEFNYQVQLLIGKNMIVDCNAKQLVGTISEQKIKGWEYNYYVVASKGLTVSTLKACSNSQESMQFVSLNSMPLLNYNSAAPIVVYAPTDLQVNYRIWHISGGMFNAVKQ